MTKPTLKLPDSKGGWASLVIGIGLFIVGCGRLLQGDYEHGWLDLTGAFGTLGLPSLLGPHGEGYHVEIKPDKPVDTSPPEGYVGMPRLSESNVDIDCDPLDFNTTKAKARAKLKPEFGSEVRRVDEHE